MKRALKLAVMVVESAMWRANRWLARRRPYRTNRYQR